MAGFAVRSCALVAIAGSLGGCPSDAPVTGPVREPSSITTAGTQQLMPPPSDAEIIGDFVAVPTTGAGIADPAQTFPFATVCPVRLPLTLRDPRGNPLSDARVRVTAGSKQEQLFRGRTSSDGTLELDLAVLQAYGSVQVRISKPFYAEIVETLPVETICEQTLELTLPLEGEAPA